MMSTVTPPASAADGRGDARFEREALVHLDRLYAAALHMTRDRSTAEELVQRAFDRAFRSFGHARPDTDMRIWLYRSLFSTWIDRVPPREVIPPASPAPGAAVDEAVREAMDGLSPNVRFTLYLADVEGFDEEQIAEITGVPRGIVVSRLRRAHRRLESSLLDWARESANSA